VLRRRTGQRQTEGNKATSGTDGAEDLGVPNERREKHKDRCLKRQSPVKKGEGEERKQAQC